MFHRINNAGFETTCVNYPFKATNALYITISVLYSLGSFVLSTCLSNYTRQCNVSYFMRCLKWLLSEDIWEHVDNWNIIEGLIEIGKMFELCTKRKKKKVEFVKYFFLLSLIKVYLKQNDWSGNLFCVLTMSQPTIITVLTDLFTS